MHDPSGFLEVIPASFNKVKLGCENSTTIPAAGRRARHYLTASGKLFVANCPV